MEGFGAMLVIAVDVVAAVSATLPFTYVMV